jgi:hypothetical protein
MEHDPEASGAAEGVAIDVGDGRGALVVRGPVEVLGFEIELGPASPRARRTHAVFHERRVGEGGRVCAAVFPSLPAGVYDLFADGDGAPTQVEIEDGAVREVRLPGA